MTIKQLINNKIKDMISRRQKNTETPSQSSNFRDELEKIRLENNKVNEAKLKAHLESKVDLLNEHKLANAGLPLQTSANPSENGIEK